MTMRKQDKTQPAQTRKPSKIKLVMISLLRTPTAGVTQREFRKAWGDRLALELDLNKIGHPIVNIRDGIYWTLDGQHRIYALRANGFENDPLECEVYEGLTDQEAAEIFLGRNTRKAIPLHDNFRVSCTAERQRELDIRRTVEANGQKVSRDGSGISAIGALGAVYDLSGDVVLGQVVRTLNQGFSGDTQAFDAAIIRGMGGVFNRFNGKTNEKELVERLARLKRGAHELAPESRRCAKADG
jgi:hypothetical protein